AGAQAGGVFEYRSGSAQDLPQREPVHERLVAGQLTAANLDDVHARGGNHRTLRASAADVDLPDAELTVCAIESTVLQDPELHIPELEELGQVATQVRLAV